MAGQEGERKEADLLFAVRAIKGNSMKKWLVPLFIPTLMSCSSLNMMSEEDDFYKSKQEVRVKLTALIYLDMR